MCRRRSVTGSTTTPSSLHGYGVVVAYGTRRGTDGEPVFIEQDIPTRGKLGEFEPRIYFGEQSPEYSVVSGPSGGQQRELDYAASGGDKMYTYTGRGGVAVGPSPARSPTR